MSDSYIAAGSQKIDADLFVRGADNILRQRGILMNAIDPAYSVLFSAALAAGASVDLDAAAIPIGKSGRFLGAHITSSAACKWVLATRDGGSVVAFVTVMTSGLSRTPAMRVDPPGREFIELPYGNGDENWRVTVTNLDAQNAADVYATVYWDEV